MRIGIDARVLERRMTGIGRYLNGILSGIKKYDDKNDYFLFSYKKLKRVDEYFQNITTWNRFKSNKLLSPFWLNSIAPKKIEELKIDLFFSPNNFLPKLNSKIIKICTIHDTVHKISKDYHPISYRIYKDLILPGSLKRSNRIITVSNNSKNDLVKFYGVDKNKIEVIYQYIDNKFRPRKISEFDYEIIEKKYDLPKDYILFMGVVENRKNISGILKIADLLKVRTNNNILIVGKKGYGFNDFYPEFKRRSNVKYIEYVEEVDIQYIYNLAKIFLFPSFYEGFGLPPLEAMRSGVPTLVSDSSSLKEVIGKGGILINPKNYQTYAEEIMKLLNDEQYYKESQIRGIQRADKFNLNNTTIQLLSIFNSFNTKEK